MKTQKMIEPINSVGLSKDNYKHILQCEREWFSKICVAKTEDECVWKNASEATFEKILILSEKKKPFGIKKWRRLWNLKYMMTANKDKYECKHKLSFLLILCQTNIKLLARSNVSSNSWNYFSNIIAIFRI